MQWSRVRFKLRTMIILVALTALGSMCVVERWRVVQRRKTEREWTFAGADKDGDGRCDEARTQYADGHWEIENVVWTQDASVHGGWKGVGITRPRK